MRFESLGTNKECSQNESKTTTTHISHIVSQTYAILTNIILLSLFLKEAHRVLAPPHKIENANDVLTLKVL
jgi:hypothetical protein